MRLALGGAAMKSPLARKPAVCVSHVLLVDPHEDTRALYASYLAAEGCDVETSADGREALVHALTRRYDAIVTETRLPGIDGLELCEVLRRDPATARTPILFVTGDAALSEQYTRSIGANALLIKPCLPELLLSALREVATTDGDAPTAPAPVENAAIEDGQTSAVGRTSRATLSRTHRRGNTTTPPLTPPTVMCPMCDRRLTYEYSYVGGVSARNAEQWDYLECPGTCGTFEYRHRTRKLRTVEFD
jgi:CheY-like chemotaxis protein